MKKIIVYMHPCFLTEFTYIRSFSNICKEYNLEFVFISSPDQVNEYENNIPYDNNVILFADIYHPLVTKESFQKIRNKLPNAKLISFGGDMQCYDRELTHCSDIFCDFTQSVCDEIAKLNPNTKP